MNEDEIRGRIGGKGMVWTESTSGTEPVSSHFVARSNDSFADTYVHAYFLRFTPRSGMR